VVKRGEESGLEDWIPDSTYCREVSGSEYTGKVSLFQKLFSTYIVCMNYLITLSVTTKVV
jgi:hypothetical protein